MSEDIVVRLKDFAADIRKNIAALRLESPSWVAAQEDLDEAADEIARLRALAASKAIP